METLELHGIYA